MPYQRIHELRKSLAKLYMETFPLAVAGIETTSHYEQAEQIEFELQRLQDYPEDASFHLFPKWIDFKKKWVGRTFQCLTTKEVFTIPMDVTPKQFFKIGEGYVDVGEGYSRFSNVREMGEQ